VTRVVIAPVAGPAAPTDCALTDGLAMCTLAGAAHGHTADGLNVVVTAFTAADPQGIEVHPA
jgi:hypothetical protein